MAVDVATEVFEGPFDLLLQLILSEKVDIHEVSLVRVVDAYLAEIDRMRASAVRLDLDIATEFLLIAATLIELKTRRLLPIPESSDLDEDLALWEERDLLLAKLLECKTFQDVGRVLAEKADLASRSWPRVVGPHEPFASMQPDLLEGTKPEQLAAAMAKVLVPKPVPVVSLAHVTPVKLTVAEAVAELLDELPRVGRLSFRQLTGGLVDRVEVIVRFLAVLELFKQGVIEVEQFTTFGEIELIWVGDDGQLVIDLRETSRFAMSAAGRPATTPVIDLRDRVQIDSYEG
jgi:segregation and condensation protein A